MISNKNNSKYVWGIVLSLLVGFFYGLAAPFSKMLVSHGINPITIVLYRTVFPMLFWGIVLYWRGGLSSFCINKSLFVCFSWIGIFLFLLKACGLVMSYKYLSVQFAIMLNFFSPICTIFLNSYLNKESPRLLQIFASILVVFGLVLAFDIKNGFYASFLGLFFAVISIAGSSLNSAYSTRISRKYQPDIVQQIFYSHSLAAVSLLVIKSLFCGWSDLALITPRVFFNLNMVAVATSVLASFCFWSAVRRISSSTLHILSSTEILVTLILVPLIAGILPTGREVVGSVIIFVALCIATIAGKERMQK